MTADAIARHASRTPGATAAILDGERVSYARLNAGVCRFAGLLAARGLPAGSTVAIRLGSQFHGWIAILAARALGLDTVAVPGVDRLATLGIANASCVVTEGAEGAEGLAVVPCPPTSCPPCLRAKRSPARSRRGGRISSIPPARPARPS